MKEYTFSKDAKILGERIDEVGRVSKVLGTNTHTVLCGCLVHAIEHGDTTLLSRLDESISNAMHKSGLRKFAIAKGPVIWRKGDKAAGVTAGFEFVKARADKLKLLLEADEDTFVDGLMAKTFWEFAPQKDFDGFNLIAQIKQVIERAEKVQTNEKQRAHEKNSFVGLAQLRNLVRSLGDTTKEKTADAMSTVATKVETKAKALKSNIRKRKASETNPLPPVIALTDQTNGAAAPAA